MFLMERLSMLKFAIFPKLPYGLNAIFKKFKVFLKEY